MALDLTPGTPDWWLHRLWKALTDDRYQDRLNLLADYYVGNHRMPEGNRKAREIYRQLQRMGRSNYTGLIANAVIERLQVIGIRSGGGDGNPELDAEAWRIWQANKMDVRSPEVMRAMAVMSVGYVMVIANPQDPKTPIYAPKDPRTTIHEPWPTQPWKPRAGLTWWDDDVDGQRHALLMLPEGQYEYVCDIPKDNQYVNTDPLKFSQLQAPDDSGVMQPIVTPNPLNPEIPLVPFVNMMDLEGMGRGEFEDVIDVQDRINNMLLDRLVISRMQAYKQRVATGVTSEDENGNPIEPFIPGADLIWTVEDENAKFATLDGSDLTPLLSAVTADIRDLAAVSRTPAYYLMGQIVNISGDGLRVADAGLVGKVRDRQRGAGESWETVNRLGMRLAVNGMDELPADAEMLWASAEYRTLAELYDAASKASAAGEPWQARMELLGKSPQEIERMKTQRIEDALLEAQYPQLESPGTPVRYTAAAIPSDATGTKEPELTGQAGSSGGI